MKCCIHLLVLSLAFLTMTGCAAKQNYQFLSDGQSQELQSATHVLEGEVVHFASYMTSMRAIDGPSSHDLTIKVTRVLRGDGIPPILEIRGFRPLTESEKGLLPNEHGLLWAGTRLLVSYDTRSGNRYSQLKLVAIGNTQELAKRLEEAKKRNAQ